MSQSDQRRTVITGMGVLSNVGTDVKTFWEAICAGRTSVSSLEGVINTAGVDSRIATRVTGFNPDDHFDKKKARRIARFVQFAVTAAREAMRDSGLDMTKEDPWRCGGFISCGIGGIDFMEEQILTMAEKGPERVSPFMIPKIISNMAAGEIAIEFGLKGPNAAIISACASSGHSMGEAMRTIRHGYADVMLAGGAEASICRVALAGFSNMKALTTRNDDPQHACRPFDRDRDGFLFGEGAGILVLEELEHAKKRGAPIYAELAGLGATDDAFHITAPDSDGAGGAMAMRFAMQDAGLNPSDVQYINAHGTSTPLNDKIETLAIKTTFGEHARKLAVSSTKSMLGHLLGAASAAEGIATALTLKHGIITPTINYVTPDPDCDLDCVPNVAREAKVEAALSNSLGFGGHNCTLAFKRYNGD